MASVRSDQSGTRKATTKATAKQRQRAQASAEQREHLPAAAQAARLLRPPLVSPLPDVLPSMFQGTAPAQLDPIGVLAYPAGELRGMYSTQVAGVITQTTWKPQWSTFAHPRGGGGHNGVDIYAPVGTPIVAVVDGALTFHAAGSSEIGNRAWLAFKRGSTSYRLIYGHLSGFAGADRSVKRGEVIGYSGCSGNANYALDCLAPGKCGVASSHVHLILKNDTQGTDLDAASALGWRLRYADDLRELPCASVVPMPVREHSLRQTMASLMQVAQAGGPSPAASLLEQMRDALEALASHSQNIDITAPEQDRARAMYALLGSVVDDLDAAKPADHRENIRRFLLHLAWHESDRLRTRKQYNNGPARSLFQFECLRAKDDLSFLKSANRLGLLTQSAGSTEAELDTAITALPNQSAYPAGNLITTLMNQNDLFAARLARLAFRRFTAAIPSDLNGHADYWYTYWKRTGGDPVSLKRTFASAAAYVDHLLGLSPAPNFFLLRPELVAERQSEALQRPALLAQSTTNPDAAVALPSLSERALNLIEQHESGGFDYYTKFALHPYFPGVSSGLTLGFGFDLGYRSEAELRRCFAELGVATLDRLQRALGVHAGQGADAVKKLKAFVAEFADITISWDLGRAVLRSFDVPQYAQQTQRAFDVRGLNGDQFGALVSLVFNRGTDMTGERRREMAAIRDALKAGKPEQVPALIRAMKRLWPTVPSLQRRRDDEAQLFEGK